MVLYSCEGVVCRRRTGDVREVKMGGIIFAIDQMSLTCDIMSHTPENGIRFGPQER